MVPTSLSRDFIITGDDGTFQDLSETCADVGEVTDHHGQKTVEDRRLVTHGYDQLPPAKSAKPVTGEQESQHRHEEPVVGAMQGILQFYPILPGHVLYAKPHKKRCQRSEKDIL